MPTKQAGATTPDHLRYWKFPKDSMEYRAAKSAYGRFASRRWARNNPQKVAALHRKYEKSHPELVNARHRRCYHKRPSHYRAWYAEQRQDPTYQIQHSVRKRLWRALRNGQRGWSGTWRWLPYTPSQLRDHLVSTFPKGKCFTLENYGKVWVIDHIKPIQAFIEERGQLTVQDVAEVHALSNLRALSKTENSRKGAFYQGHRLGKGNRKC